MSGYNFNKLDQAYLVGANETPFGAAGEELIYAMPNLLSWFSAEPAYFNAAIGQYADKGPRGNNWLQPTVAQQPTPVVNWRGIGHPALAFDGITSRIPADFNAPTGEMTLIVVCDILINDALQCLIGSNIGSVVSNKYMLYAYHQACSAFDAIGGSPTTNFGTVGTTSIPHIYTGNFSPLNGTLDAQIDGGAWATRTDAFPAVNRDVTMQLGAYRTATSDLFTGNIAEAFVFTGAMKGSADLATLTATMKAKYGIV